MLRIFKRKPITDLPYPSQMKIVCGDCGGEAVSPTETNLMSDGTCAKCAGRSFVCAERISMVLARHLLSQKTEVKN